MRNNVLYIPAKSEISGAKSEKKKNCMEDSIYKYCLKIVKKKFFVKQSESLIYSHMKWMHWFFSIRIKFFTIFLQLKTLVYDVFLSKFLNDFFMIFWTIFSQGKFLRKFLNDFSQGNFFYHCYLILDPEDKVQYETQDFVLDKCLHEI